MEFPYLTGRSKYPPPDPTVGGGAMAFMASLYPRGPINISRYLRELPEDSSVPELPAWRWIHTPGHTAGHVSLYREQDRVLLAGDAFVTTKQESFLAVAAQTPEMHAPPAYYTSDWEAAKLSVQRLAALLPQVMATGHGCTAYGPDALRALELLASGFDELARPSHGRYVGHPAVVSDRGVISVPPSQGNPLLTVAASAVMQPTQRHNVNTTGDRHPCPITSKEATRRQGAAAWAKCRHIPPGLNAGIPPPPPPASFSFFKVSRMAP